ncbi:MAG: sulfatase/phosphatase domain-containing protein, partial [Planctomycetia bacterium]
AGVKVFNAGMRAQKGTPYMGGTRVPAFWRWPKGINGTRDVGSLTAHLDILPTLAEITGAKIPENAKSQVEGRSMVPLLKDSKAPWADRVLFTHVGRWPNGMSADSKYSQVSARNNQYNLVNNVRQGEKWELFDVRQDPGEKNNLAESKPEVVKMLKSEIDQWWIQVTPMLVNEQVKGPKVNPFKEMYWKQFGGQPDARLLEKMNPEKKFKNELK